uniref:Uncharacterized protein n=1 Tax=Trichinella nativa TaxID=6335 RepID=A0A0V1KI45_9BILA
MCSACNTEETAQWLRALAALQRTLVQLPVSTKLRPQEM